MRDCFLCGRNVEDALTVRVDFGGIGVVDVCDECAARGEEGMDWQDEPETEGEAA